ncbi:MBL fold metallo-hydrolase [uncultured Gemmiger sp.]|uniref:MBL fold metallo-hydrolase n=1 Tax=uncultured Gemmiger sp. TaxID=1623490 RepID=UPI0025F7249C|nr:MBL fold metallo-hydrolase [uncultured Gemmiger sp.]
MEKKIYYAPVNHPRFGDDIQHPWKYAVAAYRVAPHVWQVGGQDDVCAYLLDSGEGLILIDTGYASSFYLMLDQIWSLGYDPRNIKKILLSHWHWDHVNGARYLAEMSGCEIWLSKEDEVMHQMHKDRTDHMPMIDYTVTNFYDDNIPVKLGRFTIETKLAPGHTPGAMVFRFDDTDDKSGKTYTCAMHGGIGVPMMRPENLEEWSLTKQIAYHFVDETIEIADWKVDIMLPSHLNMGNVLPNIPVDRNDYSVWVADYAWKETMLGRAEVVKGYYPEHYAGKE